MSATAIVSTTTGGSASSGRQALSVASIEAGRTRSLSSQLMPEPAGSGPGTCGWTGPWRHRAQTHWPITAVGYPRPVAVTAFLGPALGTAMLPGLTNPRRVLANAHEVRTLSIFDLPAQAWDLGSMYFATDRMTTDQDEFETAVRAFIGSLRPGSPFMAVFMEGLIGYNVQGIGFPTVKVSPASLESLLSRLPVANINILRTDDRSVRPLRPGYDAMLLVTGFTT